MAETILPGTYITVRDEGLITAGRIASGNIGIVGTAEKGPIETVQILGSFAEAKEIFGEKGSSSDTNALTLIRALEFVFSNGGTNVYAVRAATSAAAAAIHTIKDSTSGSADLVKLTAASKGAWGNDIKISVSNETPNKKVVIRYQTTEEQYLVDNGSTLISQINQQSNLVTAALVSGADGTKIPKDFTVTSFTSGDSGAAATSTEYSTALVKLENDIINIVLLAGQSPDITNMATILASHVDITAQRDRERIGIIGSSNTTDDATIITQNSTINNDRILFVAPGIYVSSQEKLSGAYTAAAFAGLIASLPVQASPTNKVLNIPGLLAEYNKPKLERLVQKRVVAIEKREGYRVVKGITTSTNSAWHQITTRRIVDYAKYGVRSACNPYIGKLNNDRVRGAMRATLDAFLTRMVEDEALVGYELDVTATRAQEIAGEAIVTMTIRPTFSIDFIKVTMYLA